LAQRGTPIPAPTVALLQALHVRGFGIRLLARRLDLDRNTVRKYLRLPARPGVQVSPTPAGDAAYS
jgi:hypothetical protein